MPVMRDADRRSMSEMAREIDRLAAATSAGKAAREDLTGSTFTITSLGELGGVLATPIINTRRWPSWACTRSAKRPAVIGEESSFATS